MKSGLTSLCHFLMPLAVALSPSGALTGQAPATADQVILDRLRPVDRVLIERPADRRQELTGPAGIHNPALPLVPPGLAVVPARFPLSTQKVQPSAAFQGVPLHGEQSSRSLPAVVQLPDKPGVRLPTLEADAPLEVPILASRVVDRGIAGDPTREASRRQALSASLPGRANLVPFERIGIPDPFAHRRTVELPSPPAEPPPPPVSRVQTPLIILPYSDMPR
jgi:hypothetical protein